MSEERPQSAAIVSLLATIQLQRAPAVGAISSVVCAALIRQFISSGKYNCRARLRQARKGPAVDDLGVRLVAEKLALTFVHTGGVENQ